MAQDLVQQEAPNENLDTFIKGLWRENPVFVQAQNTNTTTQDGRVNINRTVQIGGDSNDNATYQTGKVNINRTIQIDGDRRGQTGQFGKVNNNEANQGRSLEHRNYERGNSEQHRKSGRSGDNRRND